MIEYPITASFLKVIEETSMQNGRKRISKVYLSLGRGVFLKENTSEYLKCILKGTAARNAEIYVRHSNTAGRCRSCSLVLSNEKDLACPICGGAIAEISLEKRFIIDRLEIEA